MSAASWLITLLDALEGLEPWWMAYSGPRGHRIICGVHEFCSSCSGVINVR
jgi:hypothetical protein